MVGGDDGCVSVIVVLVVVIGLGERGRVSELLS